MTEETVYNEALGHFDTFYEQNRGLIYKVVKEYYIFYGELKIVEKADLYQEASFGFYKAYTSFNPLEGYKFSTTAVHQMRGYIRVFLRDKAHLIRKPRSIIIIERICKQYEITSISQFDTIEEVLKSHDITISRAKELFLMTLAYNKTIHLNAKFKDGDSEQETYIDRVPSPELTAPDKVLHNDIKDILSSIKVPERDREIVMLKSRGYSQQEIASIIGLSQMSVSRSLKSVMEKVKSSIKEYYQMQ